MRRVTADSNIYISALNFGGKPLQVVELARTGEIELAIANAIITETSRSLHHKFYWKPEDVTEAVEQISSSGGGQPRWRRDGTELFYVALDGQLMAVPMNRSPRGEAMSGDAPVPLFPANVGAAVQSNSRQQDMVSADGQRFLMNTVLEEAASPITLLLNWGR